MDACLLYQEMRSWTHLLLLLRYLYDSFSCCSLGIKLLNEVYTLRLRNACSNSRFLQSCILAPAIFQKMLL